MQTPDILLGPMLNPIGEWDSSYNQLLKNVKWAAWFADGSLRMGGQYSLDLESKYILWLGDDYTLAYREKGKYSQWAHLRDAFLMAP